MVYSVNALCLVCPCPCAVTQGTDLLLPLHVSVGTASMLLSHHVYHLCSYDSEAEAGGDWECPLRSSMYVHSKIKLFLLACRFKEASQAKVVNCN